MPSCIWMRSLAGEAVTFWPLVLHLAAEYGLSPDTPHDGLGSIRASGAALVSESGALGIKPGKCDLVAYMQYRQRYLAPYRETIVKVLKEASQWKEIPEPDGVERAAKGVVRHYYQKGEKVISIVEKQEGV